MGRPIFLCGMMGSGKTSVGKALAEVLACSFVDLDARIERIFGTTIEELFAQGEATFRAREQEALASLLGEPGFALRDVVVATGGGAVVYPGNRTSMDRMGTRVLLEVPIDVLTERLGQGTQRETRPLLGDAKALRERLEALWSSRTRAYRDGARIVDGQGSVSEVATRVLAALDLAPQTAKPRPIEAQHGPPVALEVAVPSEDLSYPVVIGGGVIDRVGRQLKRAAPRAKKVALISDDNVMPLYGARVRAALEAESLQTIEFVIPAGEHSKTPARMLALVSSLVLAGLGRGDAVLALGGGVVGDLAGLVSALFMRGIAVVQCPTSLLAQVDASVGGKVAVDLPEGKNLLGAFQFPRAVLIDPTVLDTLPDEELGCGLAEMLKHGALFDPEHFNALRDQAEAIYERDDEVLGPLVATSVALKAACVIRDPLEKSDAGKGRVVLNLGHTVGHALESVDDYALKHGQAVALGLLAAARVSMKRGVAPSDLEERICAALTALRLPTDLNARVSAAGDEPLLNAMARDKKRAADRITYIALAQLGEPRVLSLTPQEILADIQSQPR